MQAYCECLHYAAESSLMSTETATVPKEPNDVWTDSLYTCIEWLKSGEKKRILDMPASVKVPRGKKTLF